ncbi:MAG: hypothetical protein IKR49_00330 [Clostridia bacterium]|nr:hypothetical protein [Clostridia bacterium]
MTERQSRIFTALRYAYEHVRWFKEEYPELIEDEYRRYLHAANEDRLTRIQEIAELFFLAMVKFGEL